MRLVFACLAMAVVIALSNYLVQFSLPHKWIGNWLTYAAFSYPFVFLVEDLSNRMSGVAFARRVVFFGFIIGIVLSFATSTIRIAAASGLTFLCSGLCNVFVFHRLRHTQWWKAPLVSTLLASVLDTMLFFSLAFAGTDVPWVRLGMGDLAVKLFMCCCFLPVYRFLHLILRHPQNTKKVA